VTPMYRNLIFWPVLVMVALTLLVYVRLIKVKIREMKAGRVDMARRGLHEDAWGEAVLQINNNIRNQFELPVLFYVLAVAFWALDAVSVLVLVVAWLFVASRIAHAWVHLTSNDIPNRRRLFTVGWWILAAMVLLAAWTLAGRALVDAGG
jgi:hypothetical protein